MTPAPVAQRALHYIKTLGKFQIFGIICGAYCSIVTALVMSVPKLLSFAQAML